MAYFDNDQLAAPGMNILSSRGRAIAENALRAKRQANFAANAPTVRSASPGGTASFTDENGQTTKVATAPRAAEPIDAATLAQRSAYAADQSDRADLLAAPLMGANYFQNRGFANDENRRAGQVTDAQVGLIGSEAGVNKSRSGVLDANANEIGLLAPQKAKLLGSEAGLNQSRSAGMDAATATEDAMRAPRVAGAGLANDATRLANQYAPGMYADQQDARQTALKKGALELELMAPQSDLQLQLGKEQVRGAKLQNDALAAPGFDPVKEKAKADLVNQLTEQEFQGQGFFSRNLPGFGMNHNDARANVLQSRPDLMAPRIPLTDQAKALEYLRRAGNDQQKARELAARDGYSLPQIK